MKNTKNRWIPLTERMPEVKRDECGNIISPYVIIWAEHEDESGVYDWYDIAFYWPKNETFETINNGYFETVCLIEKVKAWMPLPDPYVEEER